MKKIITFAIICALCQTETEINPTLAQPLNLEQRKSLTCTKNEFYLGDGKFSDDQYESSNEEGKVNYPFSYSDCIDRILNDGDKYIEKCCYIRLQHRGTMHVGCIPLNQDQYSDIVETQRLIENGDKAFWGGELKNSKVYAIECSASYLKLAFALLLGLLL